MGCWAGLDPTDSQDFVPSSAPADPHVVGGGAVPRPPGLLEDHPDVLHPLPSDLVPSEDTPLHLPEMSGDEFVHEFLVVVHPLECSTDGISVVRRWSDRRRSRGPSISSWSPVESSSWFPIESQSVPESRPELKGRIGPWDMGRPVDNSPVVSKSGCGWWWKGRAPERGSKPRGPDVVRPLRLGSSDSCSSGMSWSERWIGIAREVGPSHEPSQELEVVSWRSVIGDEVVRSTRCGRRRPEAFTLIASVRDVHISHSQVKQAATKASIFGVAQQCTVTKSNTF